MTGWDETTPTSSHEAAAPRPYGAVAVPVLTIDTRLEGDEIAALCDQLRDLVEAHPDAEKVCAIDVYAEPDVVAVEALARLQLTARRLGGRIQLRRASARLRQLLAFTGLEGVIGCGAKLPLRLLRQPEQREPPSGVEERVEPDDPAS